MLGELLSILERIPTIREMVLDVFGNDKRLDGKTIRNRIKKIYNRDVKRKVLDIVLKEMLRDKVLELVKAEGGKFYYERA